MLLEKSEAGEASNRDKYYTSPDRVAEMVILEKGMNQDGNLAIPHALERLERNEVTVFDSTRSDFA